MTTSEIFNPTEVPQETGARWFLKRGESIHLDRGFATKQSADNWISQLDRRLDWSAGFTFRLRGDNTEMSIVDRNGKLAKYGK